MTKKPKNFLERVSKFSDLIFVHWEIDDNLQDIIEITKKNHSQIGVVLHCVNNYDNLLEEITDKFSNIMVLCIPEAGFSGQKFDERGYVLIDKLNQIQKNKKINLYVDGGINNTNIKNINAENNAININKITKSWQTKLSQEIKKSYMEKLKLFLISEKKLGKTIYPKPDDIFSCLNLCPFEKVKVKHPKMADQLNDFASIFNDELKFEFEHTLPHLGHELCI